MERTLGTRTVLERLSALLLERAGLKVNPEGFYSLRLALSARLPALGLTDAQEYLQLLLGPEGEQELRALLPLVTVGHTEFFRDPRQFAALERRVLPDAVRRARREGRKVNLWSAGCATGEEPYSLAILLHEQGASPLEVDLWATDVNPAAVEAARQGRFSARRVGVLPPERLSRYFRELEDGYEVQSLLKPYIRFGDHNLAAPRFAGVTAGSLDLILCRNVIIYFDLPTIRALMDRFLEALRPGGLLFLGYSESLFKVYEHFEMVEVEGAFVYRRPLGEAPARRTQPYLASVTAVPSATPLPGAFTPAPGAFPPAPRPGPTEARPTLVPATRVTTSEWRTPSAPPRTPPQGVPALTPPPPSRAPTAPAVSRRAVTVDLPVVKDEVGGRSPKSRLDAAARQMEKGDFPGALAAVTQLTQDEPGDLDAWLTLGNLCSLLNRPAEAREAFAQAIQREPLCVEARVFGGLAALQSGQLEEARGELGKALFLEPSLAVGHYLLAQVEERLGAHAAARRSYRNALTQLRAPQRPLAGHYPDMPDSADALSRAARYALAALEEL